MEGSAEQGRKRGAPAKEPRATAKRQRGEEDKRSKEEEAHASPLSQSQENIARGLVKPPGTPLTTTSPPTQQAKGTTRRPFFGVIDNVSSFSGLIEGPYDFGFAISITVDRQTFKGVVFKGNDASHEGGTSVFPDEEIMLNFANVATHPAAGRSQSRAKSTVNHAHSGEELRLPDITTFDHARSHESPSSDLPSDNNESHPSHPSTPEHPSTPSTPSSATSSYAYNSFAGAHTADPYASSPSPSPSPSHLPHHPDEHLPAIHSVLQGIHHPAHYPPAQGGAQAPTAQAPAQGGATPLPPQPQLQRQKQRQKKRQEKKLLELQQQQPAKYQSLLEQREKSKIPLLGDESLVSAGISILHRMESER